jgi:hypothetical protein
MTLSGELLLGAARVAGGAGTVRAMNPATGEWLEPEFTLASKADAARAAELAAAATHEDFVCLHKFVTHDASFCQICCDCVFVIVIAMVKKLWNGSAK